jgi:hypothetical protein
LVFFAPPGSDARILATQLDDALDLSDDFLPGSLQVGINSPPFPP